VSSGGILLPNGQLKRRVPMQKKMIAFGIIAVAAVLIGVPMLSQNGAASVGAQDITTARVELTTLGTTIETTGTIAPVETVLLSFGTSGIVADVVVEVGDEVSAGDVLATIDTSDLENQIARQEQALIVQQNNYDDLVAEPTAREMTQAQATLASAQSQLQQAQNNANTASNNITINCANVESAQDTLTRAQDTYADYVHDGYSMDATFIADPDSEAGDRLRSAQSAYNVAVAQCNETTPDTQYEAAVLAAQASVDQAQAALTDLQTGATQQQINSAQAQLEQARLNVENARAALADAQIIAPLSGVVSNVNVNPGQLVNTGSTVVTLVDNSTLHIDVSVDELDIAQVAVGQPARISPEALNGVEIEGTVTRIAPTSTNDGGIVTYEVRVDIQGSDAPIRIGMSTDVEILVGSIENALVVPTNAIQRDGQNEFVEILDASNNQQRVSVTAGETINGLTVVTGDLTEGLTVVIPAETVEAGGALPFGGG
jgi:HlyD family secretion protein